MVQEVESRDKRAGSTLLEDTELYAAHVFDKSWSETIHK